MILLTEPNAIVDQTLPDGSTGHVLRFDLDFLNDSQFDIKLRYFSTSGQQIKFTPRSLAINNTNNSNPVSVVYDNFLQFPHLANSGMIEVAQMPMIASVPDIVLSSVQAASSTPVQVFLSDFPMNPATFGSTGSAVVVTNTVPVNINGQPILVNVNNIPNVVRNNAGRNNTPFSGITAAGSTALINANTIIYGVKVYLSGDSIMAAAGDNLIEITDGATVIGVCKPSLPAASSGVLGGVQVLDLPFPGGYTMVNGSLNINLGTALTGGNVYGNISHA